MNSISNLIFSLLNEKLKIFLSISFGIYIFILFFQPFPIYHFDFNNKLLVVAGLAFIVFLILVLVRIVFPVVFYHNPQSDQEPIIPIYLSGLLFIVLTSVAFAFYLRYVGQVPISFFIMSKIAMICLAPPAILTLLDELKDLKYHNELLIVEKKIIQKQVKKYEEDILNKYISFFSENNNENLTLLVSEVALVKSADNYVEIVYKEGDILKKKLIRNTLKNIYQQLSQYNNFIRCHRICIVNIHHIEKLHREFNNYWLSVKGSNEQIPVSRQYILKLKEIL